MLQFKRIDVLKGIDINKWKKSKECMLCHYWFFKDIGFKIWQYASNRCHDLSMIDYELKNIAILNAKLIDYRCVLWGVAKNNAINILGNSKLDNQGILWKWTLVQIKHQLK